MAIQQQGDVILKQTSDGGEITVESGFVLMDGGITTMSYICMFGGNEQDDGRENNPGQWWGNRDEVSKSFQLRSETQHFLRSNPATTSKLLELEQAVLRDHQVFLDEGIATEVTASASLVALNTVQLTVGLFAYGEEQTINFTLNWEYTTQ